FVERLFRFRERYFLGFLLVALQLLERQFFRISFGSGLLARSGFGGLLRALRFLTRSSFLSLGSFLLGYSFLFFVRLFFLVLIELVIVDKVKFLIVQIVVIFRHGNAAILKREPKSPANRGAGE